MQLRLPHLASQAERTTHKFTFEVRGHQLSGFVARHDGRLVAYLNKCCHRPLPLDWDDGEFYDRDRSYFVCRSHGATYEPTTGLCVAGPCAGAFLEALAVSEDGADLIVDLSPWAPVEGAPTPNP